jgi:hypothetical protein
MLLFAVPAVLVLGVLISLLVYFSLRTRRAAEASWEDLLKRLIWIDRDAVTTVALDALGDAEYARLGQGGFTLDPPQIWNMIGGMKGLEVVEHNCQVLVELAAYLQRYYPEALAIAEQLRLNAREVEWHVNRLKGAEQTGNLQASFAEYAQRAVATYYLMTRHVLSLYEQVSFDRLPELQRAI